MHFLHILLIVYGNYMLTRRTFLTTSAATALTGFLKPLPTAAVSSNHYQLNAAVGVAHLVGDPHPKTPVWCFNGQVPGQAIRVRQNERVKITVENNLPEETTVHWHGIRVRNEMDGVPHLTQKPIAPGETFDYLIDVPDAGTYWYHPHHRSFEQVGRGLYGPLIVEEPSPPRVDRDLTWVLDDWRLSPEAAITDDFGHPMHMSHAGRIGNTVTINGEIPIDFPVQAGERIRLRLINAANARIFGLEFRDHQPRIIAIDGQPVTPHTADGDRVDLAPGMRVDLILDFTAKPGQRFTVVDSFYQNRAYQLVDIAYLDKPPLRSEPLSTSTELAANTLPEPNLEQAERHEIKLGGGVHGNMQGAYFNGEWADIRTLARQGKMWAVNGVVASGHVMEPLLTLQRDRSYILSMLNDSTWPHPMHLHGHSFRVIARDDKPTRYRQWQDTVLMAPGEKVDIAFVADNPGDWMFHCHILEHQMSGMMAVVKVT